MRTDQDNKDRQMRLINFNFVNIATVNTLKGPVLPLVKLVVTARKSIIKRHFWLHDAVLCTSRSNQVFA